MSKTDAKQAVENATEHGYACYDLKPWEGQGHVTMIKQDEIYDVEGRIDGVPINGKSSEEGLPRQLQELNIDPTDGWYSI